MSFESIIMNFGYPAILIGTFFEGEIILILAGFMAHRGYLHLPLVILFAFLGTLLGDQFYFFLGRNRGQAVLAKHPNWKERIARFRRLMDRYHTLIILGFRFLYGLRTVAPFAIGLSEIPAWKFFLLNAASAAVWAVIIGALGYLFGQTMELMFDKFKRYELALMAALLALAIVFYAIKRWRNSNKAGRNDVK